MPILTGMSGPSADPIDVEEAGAPPAPRAMAPAAKAFVGAVIGIGGVILAHSIDQVLSQPVSWFLIILITLTAATGLATLRVPGKEISFSISDTFSIIAAVLVGPAAGAVTAALDDFVLSCRMLTSRRSLPRVLFNMAFPAMATWISAEIFRAMAGPTPLPNGAAGTFRLLMQLTFFGFVDFGLTTFTVATAVALDSRTTVLKVWREHFVGLWITYFGGIFAAMLIMAVGRASAVEVIMLISPLPILLYVAFRHAQGRVRDQIQHLGKMNKVYVASIEALAHAVDTKDQVTHDHVRRVQTQSLRLARAIGENDPMVLEAIKAAALLHDVGKIGIPEHILNKPGKLSPSEFDVMKQHAAMGAEILSVIDFPYPVVPIVRHHHENWNGTGYPDCISGEAIPIGARILQVVDCFDALTSDRPYRRQLSTLEALRIIGDRSGTMYDPRIVDAFFVLHGVEPGVAAASELPASERPPATASGTEPAPPVAAVAPAESPLRAFYELGRSLTPSLEPHEVGNVVWGTLSAHVPASAFVLYSYDEQTNSLVSVFCNDFNVMPRNIRVAIGEGLTGWVAATGRVVLNSDARLDLPDRVTELFGLTSVLAVPAKIGDRVMAVLTFYSKDEAAFTDEHSRLVEAAAEIIAEGVVSVMPIGAQAKIAA